MGCPKWFKVNKACECGLDEMRTLIKQLEKDKPQ
jgi:hypothetical protein